MFHVHQILHLTAIPGISTQAIRGMTKFEVRFNSSHNGKKGRPSKIYSALLENKLPRWVESNQI